MHFLKAGGTLSKFACIACRYNNVVDMVMAKAKTGLKKCVIFFFLLLNQVAPWTRNIKIESSQPYLDA